MNIRLDLAKGLGTASAWGLRRIFHRPAANLPGKAALAADPRLIADLHPRLREGAVVVVGTNGKTTVTNLLADALEIAGKRVACNRTGANLDSGIATALLREREADWGVLECDELWLARIAPQLAPDYVVALNLFRDQLDRMGEIALIQQSFAEALASSPTTTLVYNADDPLCHAIAERVPNASIPFGIDAAPKPLGDATSGKPARPICDAEPMCAESRDDQAIARRLPSCGPALLCQRCDAVLAYAGHQYGHLGAYRCPRCGFSRPKTAYAACDVQMDGEQMQLSLRGGAVDLRLETAPAGTYQAYNVLAAYAAADLCGVPFAAFERAVRLFRPQNGRLERYEIGGAHVLLNLAKNPIGLDQNLELITAGPQKAAIAFIINDRQADGRDVSWLWDADFEKLAGAADPLVFAGGRRRDDVRVRLKHAGIDAWPIDGARDFLARARAAGRTSCYAIANYTALAPLKKELDQLARETDAPEMRTDSHLGDEVNAPGRAGRLRTAGREGAIVAEGPGEIPATKAPAHMSGEMAARSASTRAAGRKKAPAPAIGRESPSTHHATGPQQMTSGPAVPDRFAALKIAHLFPDLLNLYGDSGNVVVLANRARWQGLPVEVVRIGLGRAIEVADADIVFLGGGPDREQGRAARELIAQADALRAYVEDDGVLLAICGGYQILGKTWLMGDETKPGLGILDIVTGRAEGGARNRLVGDIALRSPLSASPVVGYENHAGRTSLGPSCEPFGKVIGARGHGNDERSGADGALYRNVVGTYLHGPLLARNPELADSLIARALARKAARGGRFES